LIDQENAAFGRRFFWGGSLAPRPRHDRQATRLIQALLEPLLPMRAFLTQASAHSHSMQAVSAPGMNRRKLTRR